MARTQSKLSQKEKAMITPDWDAWVNDRTTNLMEVATQKIVEHRNITANEDLEAIGKVSYSFFCE